VTTEENDFRGGQDAPYFLGSLDAVHSRHLDVEHNNIGPKLLNSFYGLVTIPGFTTNMQRMGAEKRANAPAY
jgi:hypothetical protein